MKKLSIIVVVVLAVAVWSCSDTKREQSRVYMPDMAYSRAVETYSNTDTLLKQGINYNRRPVPGTVKRGELAAITLVADQGADTSNYVAAKQLINPLAQLDEVQMKEAERLYLVNCGICHGAGLDGNGPLYKGGNGPYAAAPANLMAGDYKAKTIGQIFYVQTYGKGQMGSYASQLSSTQRWMVASYVKMKQGGGAAAAPAAPAADTTAKTTATAAAPDTAAAKK